jgi:hypothetical protein
MTRFLFSVDCGLFLCGVPSLTRGCVCNLLVQLLLGLDRASTPGSKSSRTHYHISLSHLRFPQLGGHVPVFISPKNMVAQSYPWALGSLLSPLTIRRDYGGSILTRIHTGMLVNIRPTVCRPVYHGVWLPSGTCIFRYGDSLSSLTASRANVTLHSVSSFTETVQC